MRRRQGILGALSVIAAGATGIRIDPTKAAFINSDLEARCALIRDLYTFEDFWAEPIAMHAYVHKDDPCHDVAYTQYLTLHAKPEPYSHAS
jgi:hypothetical protein